MAESPPIPSADDVAGWSIDERRVVARLLGLPEPTSVLRNEMPMAPPTRAE